MTVSPTVAEFERAPAEWDGFVRQHAGSFCHLWGWRAVMADVMGHRVRYRAAWSEAGELVGVNPLVEIETRLFGHFLLSMPFLNVGGVGSDAARRALAEDARALAQAARVDLLELRVREPLEAGLAVSARKITVERELPATVGALWDALGSKVRSQVKRPQKEGMEVRVGPDEMTGFYDVFARNMRDLGTPVLPLGFFEAARRNLPEEIVFTTVRHEGRVAAGACGFVFGGRYEMTWASSLRELNRLAPNMLLYWGCMEEMTRRGVRTFDFGRCTPGGGTHRFKLQWGGRDVPLPWAQWSASGVAATPSPDRPIFRLATAVWSRLPLAVTNRLGPWLATRLP
jgi:serine/alanine adding enzyme